MKENRGLFWLASYCYDKHYHGKQLREEMVCFILYLTIHHRGKSEQEMKQEPKSETMEGYYLLACSQAHTATHTSQGSSVPQWPGPSRINHQSRECPVGLPIGQSDGGAFSVEGPFSEMTLDCVKLTHTHQNQLS